MAGFQVCEEGGETGLGCQREEDGAVGERGEEVEEGGEKEAGCFFFGGESQESGVEGDELVFVFNAFAD